MSTKQAKADVALIRQETQYSCCAASIASAAQAWGKDVTEADVNKILNAAPMGGATWEAMLATVQYFGLRGTLVVPATPRMLKSWTDQGIPVVVAWNPEGRPWSHASTVFDVTESSEGLLIHVMDPNIPNPSKTVRILGEDEFCQKWGEKVSDSLIVRRPAMAIEREITPDGKQVVASRPGPHWNPWSQQKAEIEGEVEALTFLLRNPKHIQPLPETREKINDRQTALHALKNLVDALKEKDQKETERAAKTMPDSYAQLVSPTVWHFIRSGETKLAKKKPEKVSPPKKDPNKIEVEAPTQRNVVQHEMIKQRARGTGGAGKHHNREYDAEKGRGKSKHKKDLDKEASWEQVARAYLESSYLGNPGGKPIYPNEIDHGYDEALAGGTDVMKRLQNRLLLEQGNTDQIRPDNPVVKSAYGEDSKAAYEACIEYLEDNMVKFPKKSGWWLPAHNCGINITLIGTINLWKFEILPMFADRRAYVPEGSDPVEEPAGLRLALDWKPDSRFPNKNFPATLEVAKNLVSFARQQKTVGETFKEELKWIENHFHITISPNIEVQYILQAPKLAARRWGVNNLKTPDFFVPLDGRKAVPMPISGRPRMKEGSCEEGLLVAGTSQYLQLNGR